MALRLSAGCFPTQIVGSARVAPFVLTETVYAAGTHLPKHSHERACFILVLRGTFDEVYERRGRACEPLSLIFRPAHETHSDRFHAHGGRCLNVEIDPQWLARVNAHAPALSDSADFRGGPFSRLAPRIYHEYRQPDEVSHLSLESLFLEIAAQAARRAPRARSSRPPRWLAQARDLIHSQFREPLTLAGIAGVVNVHPVHFASVFQASYRCSVGEYVRRLKIEYACRELTRSDAPLVKIALDAGFYDQSHFSRTFKRLTGMTPTAYRSTFRAA
ncbi:MAG TPA: AraC family transcriptional regulator [Pyrinomonadaceae bacterium]|jgi:AraC family transcriptional regulator|nr:AraC family transcriptional regulator [Pyrinomonadaceae bacterium]